MMYAWCSRLKWLTLTLTFFIRLKAHQCSERHFQLINENGPSLTPNEIISSHSVNNHMECYFLCYEELKCVGFNFRTRMNDTKCQLTNTTRVSNKIQHGDWTLFYDVDAAKNERKKNNGTDTNCATLYKSGQRIDNIYTINPDNLGSFPVWCDMTKDGGGWTVFQRRQDASVDFYRDWNDYKNGFGELKGNFWLGLDKIHRLTQSGQNSLRVDLMDFENDTAYAKYGSFSVNSELEDYTLIVGNFSGNAGDSLKRHNGMKFTTKDRENDVIKKHNCAVYHHGAWWYEACHNSNLNGQYRSDISTSGINWYSWKKDRRSMKKTEMKIRPNKYS